MTITNISSHNTNLNSKTYKRLSLFYDDMISMSSDIGINKFFVRSRSHVMVTVLIASRNESFFSFEKLCDKIPSTVASRSTIKSILDDGVKQNFYEKNECIDDRRIQLYKLNPINFSYIKEWVERQHNIFK